MEAAALGMRLSKAVRAGSLNQDIPVTKLACIRLKGSEENSGSSQASANSPIPRLTSGLYRGSRGTGDGREDVEYRLRFRDDGSVCGNVMTTGFEYEVQGQYDSKGKQYMWAETPPGSGYSHIRDINVYSSHVSSIALLNCSKLSTEGALHVEVCLKLVSNDSDIISLVGEYTGSDGKTGDQRLLFIEEASIDVGNLAQDNQPNERHYHPGFDPWSQMAVAKKAARRMLDVEAHLFDHPGVSISISQGLSGRYRGSREGREGRIDLHYCLKFLPCGEVRGSMLTNGDIFEVVGWYNPKTKKFEWGETPLGTSYTYSLNGGYYAAQAASLALLDGTGLVHDRACHIEVSLKPLAADSLCLIGDYASSKGTTGDQRLVFIEATRDIDPIPYLDFDPYSGLNEVLSENYPLWRHITVVKKANDRMEKFLNHRRYNEGLGDHTNAPGVSSGRFRGSRGERDGRVDVTYDLSFLEGGLVEGTTSANGMHFEVKGWYNPGDRRFEWAETPVAAGYAHIEDVDEYCDRVARNFLFPGVLQGHAMHVEVSVGLVNVDSACLIGECTRRDGSVGDLRLVYAEANPRSLIGTTSQPSIDSSYGSIDFSQPKFEPLLEKETLV
ncbi:hypothetical protein BSKO_11702 [Bryopsis sp. KO-2023]|nr:hypothetical protein BSKO_11702 [Bryopsis sp. KO-2023]